MLRIEMKSVKRLKKSVEGLDWEIISFTCKACYCYYYEQFLA
jgi:hypothetical protein